MPEINIKLDEQIIPMYKEVLKDILNHGHTHYTFPGGRGSTKSSFVTIAIPLIMMAYPNVHVVCFRKVANTIQTSIFPQVVWGILQLGLESLFKIPKKYSTPIIYKPTGQRIMFMGLDDPMKVKSIKLPFGYIGVAWFEELDQFAGENELRTVTQSTMRGGELFWDFRTFNPPISMNNWANEYAAVAETRANTLVVRNTYLDVPKEWLGEQFIEEAEELKAVNMRAYLHEYMGEAVGTGGNVFENVEDLDMEQLIEVGDKRLPMWKTFSNIYCGIDWGWFPDPFAFVRMHFDANRRNLYIFDEYRANKEGNRTTFDKLYNKLKLITVEELVTADSAEPKSVADYRSYGAFIRGAEKGPDSVNYSMKWLQSLNHIYIDKRRCPEAFCEFVHYEYERDKDNNILSGYPDADNHFIDATRYAMEKFYKRRGN